MVGQGGAIPLELRCDIVIEGSRGLHALMLGGRDHAVNPAGAQNPSVRIAVVRSKFRVTEGTGFCQQSLVPSAVPSLQAQLTH